MFGKLWTIEATLQIIIQKGVNIGYYIKPEKFFLICNISVTEADLEVLRRFKSPKSDIDIYICK